MRLGVEKISRTHTRTHYTLYIILIYIILSAFTITCFYPSNIFILGADTFFHLKRLIVIQLAIEDNTFPFYIDTDALNGYGYGTSLFYPNFFLVPFSLLISKIGIIMSYKLMLFSFILLTGVISYISSYNILKNRIISFIFSILYTFSLYHFSLFSFRNALGEFLAFTFTPLIFWGIYEICQGDYRHKWYLLSIGFSCIILSNILNSLILSIIIFIIILFNIKKLTKEPKRFLYLISSAILCLLLVSFFLFPLIEQIQSNTFYYKTNPYVADITEYTVSIKRLLVGMFTGFTKKYIHPSDIGITLIIPIFFYFLIKDKKTGLIKLANISLLISFLLTISITAIIPWKIFPFNKLDIIQFPWRLLGLISFFLAISGSIYLYYSLFIDKKRHFTKISIFLIIICGYIYSIGSSFQYYMHYHVSESEITIPTYAFIGGSEYIPSKIPLSKNKNYPTAEDYLSHRGNKNISLDNTLAKALDVYRFDSKFNFNIDTNNQLTEAELPLIYYKGYSATLDGKSIPISQSINGLLKISTQKSGSITVWYKGTLIQKISFIVSLITLSIFVMYITTISIKHNFSDKYNK